MILIDYKFLYDRSLKTQTMTYFMIIHPCYLHPTLTTQPFQTQQTSFQIQSEVQIKTTTPSRQPTLQTLSYAPAQNTQTQNIQPGSLQSRTPYCNSRNLYKPSLQIIPNISLRYSLTSTNPNHTQHSSITHNPQKTHPFSLSYFPIYHKTHDPKHPPCLHNYKIKFSHFYNIHPTFYKLTKYTSQSFNYTNSTSVYKTSLYNFNSNMT